MKLGKQLVCIGLALLVLLSAAWVVSAEEQPQPAGLGTVRGRVESKSESHFVLSTQEGDALISVDANTHYWVQGMEQPTLADVQIGDVTLVLGLREETGSISARIVLVVPPVPVGCLRGQVTAIEGQTLIVAARGEEKELVTNEDTQFRVQDVEDATLADIQVGDRVFVLGEANVTGTPLAKLVALIPEGAMGPVSARGRVTAVAEGSLMVQVRDNVVTVIVGQDTSIHVPGTENPALSDVRVGDWVLAIGRPTDWCQMTALAVGVLPAVPTHRFAVRGKVEGIRDSTITVQNHEGQNRLILTDDGTRLIVAGVEEPTIADIHIGDRIAVLGAPAEDKAILARLIVVKPSMESQTHEPSL